MQAVQTAPPAGESASAAAAEAPPQELTIEQTLRIMDVATLLRKEQAAVQQQLNLEETKAMLRTRLLDAAKVTGENLTVEQVDVAIEHYYDKLYVFKNPTWSLELMAAHLYVMRGTLIKWTLALGAVGAWFYWS